VVLWAVASAVLADAPAPAANTSQTGSDWAFTAPPVVSLVDDGGEPRSSLESFGFTTPTAARARRHLETAQQLMQQRQWDGAVRELQAAARIYPKDNAIQIQLAQALTLGGNYMASLATWRRLSDGAPESAWLKARLGGAELRLDRQEDAEKDLRAALAIDPSELSARFHLSCLLILRGDIDAARRAAGSMNLLEVGTLATWVGDEYEALVKQLGAQGYSHLCAFVLTGGEEPAKGGANPMPSHTAAEYEALMTTMAQFLWRGYENMRKGDWTTAEAALAEGLRAGLRAPAVLNDIAFCRAQRGEIDQARKILLQLVKFYPDSPLVLSKYGAFCLQQGDVAEATRSLARAHDLQPYEIETALNLASAYSAQTNATLAWEILGKIPAGTRAGLTNWFGQPRPYIAELRSDARYAEWLEGQ
jgi:Flp pilus assembly protein TadD